MRSLQDAGMVVGRDRGSLHLNLSPTVADGERTRVNAMPGPSAPPQDPLDGLYPTPSADKFLATYPTIDELNARDDWNLPPVPLGDPRPTELSYVPGSSKLAATPGSPQLLGQSAVPSEELADGGSSDVLRRPVSPPAMPFSSPIPPSPPTASQSQMPLNSFPLYNSNLQDLPAPSSVSPPVLAEWVEAGYRILVLDVRTRERFENEHLPLDAIVCIEPGILMRSRSDIQFDQRLSEGG
jgi:ubiquitin carboxyl-terminal hydrolase 8